MGYFTLQPGILGAFAIGGFAVVALAVLFGFVSAVRSARRDVLDQWEDEERIAKSRSAGRDQANEPGDRPHNL